MSRVVLVTGASRGIGLAIADRFAALGDKVAITYNSTAPSGKHLALKCDVTNADDVEAAFSKIEAELGAVEL
jgi:3-oxoacyl-[acyl-carrier protein] reductase